MKIKEPLISPMETKTMTRLLSLTAAILMAFTGAWAIQESGKGTAKSAEAQAVKNQDGMKPEVLTRVQPQYPEEARKNKIQGLVKVDATINKEGDVVEAVAVDPPDPSLGQAAVDAVKQWKFKPAVNKKGKPAQVKMTVSINFKLK